MRVYLKTCTYLLLLIVNIYAASNSGYILNFDKNRQSQKLKENKDDLVYNNLHFQDLINHNIGLLETRPDEQISQKLIEKYGKQQILNPVLFDFIFMIESDNLVNQNNLFNSQTQDQQDKMQVKLDVCNNFQSDQNCLINRLFNSVNKQSSVNQIKKIYGEQNAHLYSTYPQFTDELKDSLLYLVENKNGKIDLKAKNIGTLYTQTLQNCLNQGLGNEYQINLISNEVKKNGNQYLNLQSINKQATKEFFQDLCAITQISRLVQKSKNPHIVAFDLKSFSTLDKLVTSDEEKIKLIEIFNSAYNTFVSNLMKKFEPSEISGQLLFTQVKDEIVLQKRQLTEQQTSGQSFPVIPPGPNANVTYQIMLWIFVVILFAIFFSVLTLFTMNLERDSLLYAKFLTVDQR